MPKGYAPFNIAALNGQLYVSYAQQDADAQIDLARIGFVIGNELRDGLRRHRWMDHHYLGLMHQACDRHEITLHVEAEFVVERHVDRRGRAVSPDRVERR